ncbi:DUF1918 domain-containing protein [Streptomyces sp. NPDC019396]|uniref:DUF1918 domain-containing protein n=1 Tax=Streptomyces sp. NPDC019396 TaxID=3154687 RepID=UPI0033E3ABB3
MRAHLGDQLVIESTATGGARRDGEIVGLRHEDGTPPYDVRWSDTDEVTLVFPGPDAHIRHLGQESQAVRESAWKPGVDQPGAGAGTSQVAAAPDPGDIGRRVGVERERQGLTRAETARRAGIAPTYLAYLEEHPADPSPATLISLAAALTVSVPFLRGDDTDLPSGQGTEHSHSRLRALGPDECRAKLSTHGVGRIAVTTPEGPAVVPVNYEVVDDMIAFRTAPDSVSAAAAGADVAFEIDHADETLNSGWSVLAVGPARIVTEPEAQQRLAERAHTKPWAGSDRDVWVVIRPEHLTGRSVGPADGEHDR